MVGGECRMMPKFRVFDKSINHIGIVEYIDFKDKVLISKTETFKMYTKFENAIFLQSTGLTDKNGIEIFEGDILELRSGVGVRKFEVIYDHAKFVGKGLYENEGLGFDFSMNTHMVEVIGNIHEGVKVV